MSSLSRNNNQKTNGIYTLTNNFFSIASPAILLVAVNLIPMYPKSLALIRNEVGVPVFALIVNDFRLYSSNSVSKKLEFKLHKINVQNDLNSIY